MIKLISFDIGGTLILNEDNNEYDIKSLSSIINKPYEIVRKVYKNIFQKKIGSLKELVYDFCKVLEIEVTDELINFIKKKYENNNVIINQDVYNVIEKLKEEGYQVILFSNSSCLQNKNIPIELVKLLDGIFYSYDLGYTKSDEESYRYIEEKMNCLPNVILHIGDNLNSDYLKPIEYGWQALYYGITKDENIKSIREIEEIFNYLNIKVK